MINNFIIVFFFCVLSVIDFFNRVILYKERFIDLVKVNVCKKIYMDDCIVYINMVKVWFFWCGFLYKY